jgi:hypothetical protein
MNPFRKARTFLSIFSKSPLQAWDVFQLKLENRLGRSVHGLSGRRRSTRRFELNHTEKVPSHFRSYGNYILDPDVIGEKPVVFSAGVGEFIDFDRALLEQHDVRLFLIDPTPSSKRYIEQANLPANASFHALAISNKDGQIELFPDNVEEDILKLDIEGAAIAALNDTLDAGIYPTQIAAEFERPIRSRDVHTYIRELEDLFSKLRQAGYRIYRTRPDTIGFQVEVLAVRDQVSAGASRSYASAV